MDEQANTKRIAMSFKREDMSEAHRRLFNYVASSEGFDRSRGSFMEEAIELLAAKELGKISAHGHLKLIEANLAKEEATHCPKLALQKR